MAGNGSQPLYTHCALKHSGAADCQHQNDSAGHCLQYCSYTTMENDTKEMIHVATIDKLQTSWNSVIMGKEDLSRP
ncbi:uncharacterized protein AKAME5_001746700 [Lates japonicus]|uniref:Uncharacterized protein n=1 Tax=Lates japonicus TaxID=270547 RepID=A0AAD3N675_LATJO|nr:uncharacterized protein AKAME5_001746700 [Lates japonicus]